MQYVEVKYLFNRGLNILDARIAKFDHLVAICTDEVVMLFVSVRLFVLREILAKLML